MSFLKPLSQFHVEEDQFRPCQRWRQFQAAQPQHLGNAFLIQFNPPLRQWQERVVSQLSVYEESPCNFNCLLESESESMAYIVKPPHYQTRSSFAKKHEPMIVESPRFGRTLSSTSGKMNSHAFVNKTVIKPETCSVCERNIKFTKIALKCKNCRATCHPECKDKVPIPCVTSSTPSKRNAHGQLVSSTKSSISLG